MKKATQPHGGEIHIIEKGESGNPKGRPKKAQNVIRNLYLDEADIRLSDGQIRDILRGYLSKTKAEIDIILSDPNVPMAVKVGYQLMSSQSKKGNSDLFKWLFEMQVGKAKQAHTGGVNEDGTDKPLQIIEVRNYETNDKANASN